MRVLVILVALTGCSAQLVVPYSAPWVLPSAKLITNQEDTAEVKPVALHTPYTYPLASPYTLGATPYTFGATPYTFGATPYAYPYTYTLGSGFKATEFPYIFKAAEEKPAADAPAVEAARRRKREAEAIKVPLPYLHAVPAVAKTTFETKQLEAKEAATPADTTKLELTTKQHEVSLPAVKYVQPVVNYEPQTYSSFTPSVLPYNYPITPYSYPFMSAPVINL